MSAVSDLISLCFGYFCGLAIIFLMEFMVSLSRRGRRTLRNVATFLSH